MARNYSRKESPKVTDLALIWDSENSDWRLSTLQSILDLFNESTTNTVLEADSIYNTPTTGFSYSVTATSTDKHILFTPAGTLATGTIVLPSAEVLRDKQTILVTSSQEITALTVDGNGTTVNGAPTTIAANGYFTLKYDLTLGVWNRIG